MRSWAGSTTHQSTTGLGKYVSTSGESKRRFLLTLHPSGDSMRRRDETESSTHSYNGGKDSLPGLLLIPKTTLHNSLRKLASRSFKPSQRSLFSFVRQSNIQAAARPLCIKSAPFCGSGSREAWNISRHHSQDAKSTDRNRGCFGFQTISERRNS